MEPSNEIQERSRWMVTQTDIKKQNSHNNLRQTWNEDSKNSGLGRILSNKTRFQSNVIDFKKLC